jgi:hypothetical protein
MIELTQLQSRDLHEHAGEPVRVHDPETDQEYVLLKLDAYKALRNSSYDDSPWTDEEMDALAGEVDAMLDDDMAIEEKP